MPSTVDLRQLAIDRGDAVSSELRTRRPWLTRYVIPIVLLLGFATLVTWASWDMVFPAQRVTVMPVLSTTAEIQQEGTPLFNAAGWVEPRPTPVRIAALAPGVVERLLVVEDQAVEANEPVAELVKDDAELAYHRAQALLKLSQAEQTQAQADLRAATTRFEQPVHLQANLHEADAALAKLITELKNLPFELRRVEADLAGASQAYQAKLAAKSAVAGVQVDLAKSRFDAATAQVEEIRSKESSLIIERTALTARRDAMQTQLELLADERQAMEVAAAQAEAAQARVDQAQVNLDEAKLRLDRMTVRAPIAGRVFRLIAEPGTRVGETLSQASGSDGSTVVTMYRPDRLQIRVDVRFENIPQIGLHQQVKIDNPALSSEIMGEVLFMSSEADIQKNTLEVKVAINDPPSVFKPEMLVDVTFLAPESKEPQNQSQQQERILIPAQLVQQSDAGTFVWLADQSQGIAKLTRIELGSSQSQGLVEVTSGLTATSRLIVDGRNGLSPGQRIRVTGEDMSLGANAVSGSQRQLQRLHEGDE